MEAQAVVAPKPHSWDVPYYLKTPRLETPKKNNETNVPYKILRQFSVVYPIARACINYRKSQVTQLDWTIAPINPDEDKQRDTKELVRFFEKPYGSSSRFRRLVDIMVEDLMVIDAVALYLDRQGSGLTGLVPIDPTTIKVRVDSMGRTPEAPEIAYEQWINGKVQAEMTVEEMIYDYMNPRSNSPYGLSPLESLVTTVNTALRTATYNSDYLTKGNIPEGFVELKETLASSPDDVRKWQEYFDLLLEGRNRGLKVVPEGANYTPTKKPEDMSFERFESWLLQTTCAVFGVPPEEIGFTANTNRATADAQREVSVDRGLKPLARFLQEIFSRVVQEEFGYEDLEFKFTNLDPVDEEAEINKMEKDIKLGIRSVDEIRQERGLEPIGLSHYVEGNVTSAERVMNPPEVPTFEPTVEPKEEKEESPEEKEDKMKGDLIKWRNKCFADLKRGREEFRGFESELIPESVVEEIEDSLSLVDSKEGVYKVFDSYLSVEGNNLRKAEVLLNEIRKYREQN